MYDYDMKVTCNSAIEAALQMLIITHGRATLHLFDNSPEIPLPPQKNKYWEHIWAKISLVMEHSALHFVQKSPRIRIADP